MRQKGNSMSIFGKRAVSFALAGTLAFSSVGLVACGGNKAETPQETTAADAATTTEATVAEPTTAAELVKLSREAENGDNFQAVMDMDMTISLGEQEVPTVTKMNIDWADGAAKGTGSTTAPGVDTPISYDMYIEKEGDKYVTYTGTDVTGQKTWTKQTADSTMFGDDMLDDSMLANATFAKSGTDYTITISGKDLMDALEKSGTNPMASVQNTAGSEEILKAFNESTAVFTYGSDYLFKSMNFAINTEIDLSSMAESAGATEEVDPAALKMGLKMDMTMTVSNYGSVDPTTVAVPADVKANATDATAAATGAATNGTATDAAATDATATESTDAV